MLFLTDLDPNARVKGTRDPLGIQSVWTRFARLVVGGLTSQTTSLNDFRILLMGSWLIDQLDSEKIPDASVFVCWEQLAAYARLSINDERGFRGVTRVSSRLAKHDAIQISSSKAAQILTNQAGYGIWGLYRSTAWSTGLLSMQRPYVHRPEVVDLVNTAYVPQMEKEWGKGLKDMLYLISKGGAVNPARATDSRKLAAIASTVVGKLTEAERRIYTTFILDGGPDGAGSNSETVRRRQRRLSRLLLKRNPARGIPAADLRAIAASTDDKDLASALEDILAGAALLGAASRIFSYISRQDGSTIQAEVRHLEDHFAKIPHLISSANLSRLKLATAINPKLLEAPGDKAQEIGRWLQIGSALEGKDFATLVKLVLKQNEVVSQAKGGGAGWVALTESGAIKVTLPDDGADLDGWSAVDDPWIEPYYVGNLLGIARELGAA